MGRNTIRSAMAMRGDTQKSLARYLGIAESTMSQKINGKREFSVREAVMIADRYGMTVEEMEDAFLDP